MINARWLIFGLGRFPADTVCGALTPPRVWPSPCHRPFWPALLGWTERRPRSASRFLAMQGNAVMAEAYVRGNGRFGPLQIPRPLSSGPVYFLVGDIRASYELTWRSGFRKADVELRAAGDVPAATATPRPILATPLPTDTPTRPANTVPGP